MVAFFVAALLTLFVAAEPSAAVPPVQGCCCCTGQCLFELIHSPPCPCPQPPPGQKPPPCPLETVVDLYRHKYSALLPDPGHGRDASTFHPAVTKYTAAPEPGATALQWSGTGGWTAGFYPGLLWQLANSTGKGSVSPDAKLSELFAAGAAVATKGLEPESTDSGTHDVGFIIFGSFGNGVELGKMGDDYVTVLDRAAHTLATRWSPKVGMIRSWGAIDDEKEFEVIIDNLMNLELLFWVADRTSNDTLRTIAHAHATKTGELWLRADNSTVHLCVFSPETGALLKPCTGTPQGYSADSTWSRGQAWGIYGWTMAHRYTKDPQQLLYADRAADYYLKNVGRAFVPLWDFDAPKNESWPDTSAAAITASALVELSAATGNATYSKYAVSILSQMFQSFVIQPTSDSEAVFYGNRHDGCTTGVGNEARCTIIETEYYAMEAIRRLEMMSHADDADVSEY